MGKNIKNAGRGKRYVCILLVVSVGWGLAMKKTKVNRKNFIWKFVLVLLVMITVVAAYWVWARSSHQEKAKVIASQVAGYIETRIENMEYSADVLGAWLDVEGDEVKEAIAGSSDGKVYKEEFEQIASAIYSEESMTSVQMIPNGIVRYIYPMEGNETLVGTDVMEGEEAEALEEASKSGESVVTGPYFVAKIGLGMNFRMPVYYENGDLWGYTSLTMRLPEALEPLALSRLTDLGYDYELFYLDESKGGKKERVAGTIKAMDDATVTEFSIRDKTWHLVIRPIAGWINIGAVFLTVLGAVLLAFFFTWLFEHRRVTREEAMSQLRADAKHDKMTNLLNHTASAEAIDTALKEIEGGVLLLIDIDNFKQVNDRAGHLAGDEVLVEVANAMRTTFRRHDILGRYGGDEFIVYMRGDISIPDFSVKASQFQRKLRKIPIGNTGSFVTCSIGGARRCIETPTAETLVHRADQALYISKGAGKDRFTIFDDSESTVMVTPKDKAEAMDNDYVVSE